MIKTTIGILVAAIFLGQLVFIQNLVGATRNQVKTDESVETVDLFEQREAALEGRIEILMQRLDEQRKKLSRVHAECRKWTQKTKGENN